MDDEDRLYRLQLENQNRKNSSIAGGSKAYFDIDFLLRYIDKLKKETK